MEAKRRGFKRITPAEKAENKTKNYQSYANKVRSKPETKQSKSGEINPIQPGGFQRLTNKDNSHRSERVCHFFNNGECKFGDSCKYLHKKNPECFSGSECNRNFCPFRHSRSGFREGRHRQLGDQHNGWGPSPPPPGHPAWGWGYGGQYGQQQSQWNNQRYGRRMN